MKKAVIFLAGVAGLFLVAIFAMPRLLRDPEISNPEDVEGEGEAPVPPEFFASNPRMTAKGPHVLQERIVEEGTGKGLEGAPYFFELADGRYVFGHTDAAGHTRTLFTESPVPYRIYWYDEALAKWKEKQARNSASRNGQSGGRP